MKIVTFTEADKKKIVELYLSKMTIIQVAREMGLTSRTAIEPIIRAAGIKRSISDARRIRWGNLNFKENAFDILTPDALYWIGFLYADGSISGVDNNISLNLAGRDVGHLQKLNEFLGGDLNIRDVTPKDAEAGNTLRGRKDFSGKIFRLCFNSTHIHSIFIGLGFTNNKSIDAIPHDSLKFSRDFWRGVVDGDGWVCACKKSDCRKLIETIGLSGTQDTLVSFVEFIESNNIVIGTTPRKDNRGLVWKMDIHSKVAKKVLDLLYKDSTTYLDRKYQKYLEIINSNNLSPDNL